MNPTLIIVSCKRCGARCRAAMGKMNNYSYITLDSLATRLNLPQKFLKDLVKKGDIPYLDVNGRLKFSEPEVREALANLAQKSKTRKGVVGCTVFKNLEAACIRRRKVK